MSQSARWFVDVSDQIFAGIGAHAHPAINQFVEELGLEGADLAFVQVAHGCAPEPITAGDFYRRSPYGNPEALEQQMEDAVGRGWLEAAGEGRYRLTTSGREAAEKVFVFGDEAFARLEALPDADLERIYTLLDRVVQGIAALPEPAEKRAFSWVGKFDRALSAPPMPRVRRRLLDVRAFRDDAHLAAWQPYEQSGQVWEAFTFVWRGEAGTAAELAEELSSYRNYDEKAYAAALQDLAARGWIATEEGRYAATQEGKRLRQEAEDATDRYFDAAWESLGEAEVAELKGLLAKMAKALEPAEEETAS